MPERTYHTTTAFRELIDLVRDADQHFLSGPRAVTDEVTVAEGYRWLTEVLATAGHRRGRIWFRWFLPEAMPARPTTRVVPMGR